ELANGFNKMSNQTRATRIFQVSQFGIYNSDCPHKTPSGVSVNPIFVLNENEKFIMPDVVYLVDYTNKTVYMIDKEKNFQLIYNPNDNYSLCVFSKNKLFLCNKNSFKQSADAGNKKFIVAPLSENADNLVDFKKALEI